jgi:trehalose 6-phosphate phosphatase
MRDILAEENRSCLARVAESRALLAFDYDGTLAPIVSDPRRAAMREATRELLGAVADAYSCVVVSGRTPPDLERRLDGLGLLDVIGDHGRDPAGPALDVRSVRRSIVAVKRSLAQEPGLVIDERPLSLAIHYRACARRAQARAAIAGATSALDGLRVVHGKCVVNLVPRAAANKGVTVTRARERFGADLVLYVGDDETDEDVFGLNQPQWLVGVRVRAKRTSLASFYLRDQRSVDSLLATLLQLRHESWARTDACSTLIPGRDPTIGRGAPPPRYRLHPPARV